MTLKNIARMAGVSPAAVSRVLNNSGYVRMEKRERIQQLLTEYGYESPSRKLPPSPVAKHVLVIADGLGVSDAYIDYICGIREKLLLSGYQMYLYLSGVDSQQSQRETEQMLLSDKIGFAGILLISTLDTPHLRNFISTLSSPVVLLNRNLPGADVSSVILNNYKVGFMATQFLISKGHRTILHLAGRRDSVASQERIRGYQDAMIDNGAILDSSSVIYGDHSYEKGYEFGLRFFRKGHPASAIFIASDRMALGFVDAIYEKGLRCPEDISIICTEDTRTLANWKVPISTIGYNNKVIGRTAAELFLELLLHPGHEKKTVLFSPQIIERDSVSALPT